jgi:hypothetical protein
VGGLLDEDKFEDETKDDSNDQIKRTADRWDSRP